SDPWHRRWCGGKTRRSLELSRISHHGGTHPARRGRQAWSAAAAHRRETARRLHDRARVARHACLPGGAGLGEASSPPFRGGRPAPGLDPRDVICQIRTPAASGGAVASTTPVNLLARSIPDRKGDPFRAKALRVDSRPFVCSPERIETAPGRENE